MKRNKEKLFIALMILLFDHLNRVVCVWPFSLVAVIECSDV